MDVSDSATSNNFWKTICSGEDLIDVEKALNSSTPQFNDCFRHVVLTWPVAVFLLFGTVYQIYVLAFSRSRGQLKWTWLLALKLIVSAILVAITTASMGLQIARIVHSDQTVDFASNLASVLEWLCMLDLLILTECNRRRGRRACAVIFLAWLILTICGALQFSQTIIDVSSGASRTSDGLGYYQDILYLCFYPLVLLQLVLHSSADVYKEGVPLDEHECPEAGSSFLRKVTFLWMLKLATQCYKRSLTHQDLWTLRPRDASTSVVPRWEKYWHAALEKQHRKTRAAEAEPRPIRSVKMTVADDKITTSPSTDYKTIKRPGCPSLVWNLFKTVKWQFIPGIILNLCGDVLSFASPLILKTLLAFVSNPQIPLWIGILFAFLMLLCNSVFAVLGSQAQYRMSCLGMNVRTALTSTVYKKALRLSTTAKKGSTTGEMVNLMAVDIQRLSDLSQWGYRIWSAPIMVCISLYLLYGELGLSALAGFGVMLCLTPINFVLGRFQRQRQVKMMAFKDQRMKLMNEILNGMKVLKLYAWEPPFEKKVNDVRKKELGVLKLGSYFDAINSFTFSCTPFLIAVASFAAFVLSSPDNVLTAEKAFVSLSLFNLLRPTINMLPMIISFMVQASVSNKRLKRFLSEPELNPNLVVKNGMQEEAILIENGTFAWNESDEKSTLIDINLSIKPGQLVAVVGPVGCGKSSLLSAILGDMEARGGVVSIKGSVAYVAQQAWIQSLTLRNNITFVRPYSESAYNRAVDACALRPDFEILPNGDGTEIGEKGINLSGGQKQRISLARAVYQERDVYLMDDPLSAVDAHVGRHIFDNVIGNRGLLKEKTRVLVTHSLAYLKDMDNIFVIKDGRISDSGTLAQLLHRKGPFAEFLETYLTQRSQDPNADPEDELFVNEIVEELQKVDPTVIERLHSTTGSDLSPLTSRRASVASGKVAPKQESKNATSKKKQPPFGNGPLRRGVGQGSRNEKVQKGKVQWRVYRDYLESVGFLCFLAIVAAFICSSVLGIELNIWLSDWSQDSTKNESMSVDTRLAVYASLGIGQGLFVFMAVLMNARFLISAGAKLHQRLLHKLMRSPMSFYDVTPLGVILSRVGKDVDTMDNMLPMNVRMFIYTALNVVSAIIVIIIGTPIVGVAVVPLMIMYYFFQKFFVCTSRQVRRLESASRAPIYSHFGETISGATSIRAFAVERQFIDEADFRLDENMRAFYAGIASDIWMIITLQCIGNFLVLFAALFAVLMRDSESNAGLVGLSITYAMTITFALMMSVFTASNLETNIVSVERIKEYTELPTEAPWVTSLRPAKDWPPEGIIDFDHLELRYQEGLELVLKGLDWRIDSNEKVGVVGRTGAGKSSTTLALFRIVEPAGGKIVIDGIDISKIGLHDLRSRLAIIPQDPILFSGSLRNNLDPFDNYEDAQVWAALEHAHLKPFIAQLPGGLQHEVTEGGENLSVGQRQLLCLARALLRHCRILVLDEATAAVDLETERLILETIRSSFAHCTIITIAHRLNTIMDSDKVLVMSQGRASEHDSPSALLSNPNSAFFSMAKNAGLVDIQREKL